MRPHARSVVHGGLALFDQVTRRPPRTGAAARPPAPEKGAPAGPAYEDQDQLRCALLQRRAACCTRILTNTRQVACSIAAADGHKYYYLSQG